MSDFFDDENLAEEQKESSSAKVDIKKQRPKKLLPKVIAGVLAISILAGGTFAVIKFIPEKEDNTSSSKEFKTIDVLNLKADDVKTVSVINDGKTYVFNCDVVKNENSDTESKKWYLDGVNKELQDTSSVSTVITGLVNIQAVRKITEKSAELCGLKDPKKQAEITTEKDEKITVFLGDISPDNSGYYLKLSSSDDIYLVESSITTSFSFDELTFASTNPMPAVDSTGLDSYFNEGTLTTFDSLTISGKNYAVPLVIVPNNDKDISEYIPFKITSPEDHYADKIDSIFEFFQNGITVVGAYSYDTSDSCLSIFGLDNPDLTMSMKLGSKVYTNKFKLMDDGDYAAVSNCGNLIYKVSASTISDVVNSDATKYYSSIICLFSIDNLDSLTINAENKSYDFKVKKIDDEDSEDGYEIKLDGKKIDCSSFQNLYQYILTFGCFDYTTGETDKNDAVTLTFNMKDENPATVRFEKSSDTKYQYSINGRPIGKIQSSKIDKLIKYTKKLANGEKISQLN